MFHQNRKNTERKKATPNSRARGLTVAFTCSRDSNENHPLETSRRADLTWFSIRWTTGRVHKQRLTTAPSAAHAHVLLRMLAHSLPLGHHAAVAALGKLAQAMCWWGFSNMVGIINKVIYFHTYGNPNKHSLKIYHGDIENTFLN